MTVFGMHRSGTSALTRVLSLHGFVLPRTLIPASDVNERGFWESARINALNNEILESLNQTWFSIAPIPRDWNNSPSAQAFADRARAVLAAEFGCANHLLLKDPRICRLADFWRSVLGSVAERQLNSFILRNPIEVALSLEKRNGFDQNLSKLLWLRYCLDAEAKTRGTLRCFVNYQDLLDDWRNIIRRLRLELSLPLECNSNTEAEVDDFLTADLRHHRIDDQSALADLSRTPQLYSAYHIFYRWGRGEVAVPSDFSTLDEIRSAIDITSPIFLSLVERGRLDRKQATNLEIRVSEANDELARAHKKLVEFSDLQQIVDKQSQSITRLADAYDTVQEALTTAVDSAVKTAAERASATEKLAQADLLLNEKSARIEWFVEAYDTVQKALTTAVESAAKAAAGRASAMEKLAQADLLLDEKSARIEWFVEAYDTVQKALTTAVESAAKAAAERESVMETLVQANLRLKEKSVSIDALASKLMEAQRNAEKQARERKIAANQAKLAGDRYRATKEKLFKSRSSEEMARRELASARDEIAGMKKTPAWRVQAGLAQWKRQITPSRLLAKRAQRRREQRMVTLIHASDLFDAQWYLEQYPDVAQSKIDPVLHYFKHGWREGRDPGPQFNTNQYLRDNADVAAARINPLAHFLEYGLAEGRDTITPVPVIIRKSTEDFGPAHPCVQFETPKLVRPQWQHANEIKTPSGASFLKIGETPLGFLPVQSKALHQDELNKIVALFSLVSGKDFDPNFVSAVAAAAINDVILRTSNATPLVDGWFVNDLTLRTRWRLEQPANEPFLIRAYQYRDSETGGAALVTEKLVQGEIGWADAELINPFMPVLFVECSLEGELIAASLLAFPSLCRGGLHYGELLALNESRSADKGGPIDIIEICRTLVQNLIALIAGRDTPLLSCITVDLREADGTEPVFLPEFQQWLRLVHRIRLIPGRTDEARDTEAIDYLKDALTTAGFETPARFRSRGSICLHIPADAMPCIEALVASPKSSDTAFMRGNEIPISFIWADREPAATKILVTMPPDLSNLVKSAIARPAFPIMTCENANSSVPARLIGAIRFKQDRPLSDANIIMPVAPEITKLMEVSGAGKVTAIMRPLDWNSHVIFTALQSLHSQRASEQLALVLLSDLELPDEIRSACDLFFAGRWQIQPTLSEMRQCEYLLVLGQNMVLHDPRTLQTLIGMLEDTRAVTASCVVIRSEETKKGQAMTCHSAGLARLSQFGEADVMKPITDMSILQRATYPVAANSPLLWMTRTRDIDIFEFPSISAGKEQYHLCTSLVTASLSAEPHPSSENEAAYPMSAMAIGMKVLNG